MHSVKLVHSADMHLGSIFSNVSYDNAKIRQSEAVHTALKIINEARGADILLLSGDIFDNPKVPRSVLDAFLNAVASIETTSVFYSCGNHDSYYTPAVSYCRENAPGNLHIFLPDEVSTVTLEDKKVKVYGVSYSSEHTDGTMLNEITACDDAYINILCTHSDLVDGMYNPCNLKLMSELGFDYVALGHIHAYSGIKNNGNMFYAYPGIPEPTGFDECGVKGYIKGKVSKHEKNLEFIACQKRKYIDETIDISDFKNEFELSDVLGEMTESAENICRFTFVGENKFSSVINTELIEAGLNCFGRECVDKSHYSVSASDYADIPGLKGMCAQKAVTMLADAQTQEEKNMVEKAFRLLLDCFENR